MTNKHARAVVVLEPHIEQSLEHIQEILSKQFGFRPTRPETIAYLAKFWNDHRQITKQPTEKNTK